MLKTPRYFENLIFNGCFISAAYHFACTAGNWEIKHCIRPLWFLPFTKATAQKYKNLISPAPDG